MLIRLADWLPEPQQESFSKGNLNDYSNIYLAPAKKYEWLSFFLRMFNDIEDRKYLIDS